MEISAAIIKGYLLLVLLGGLYGVVAGLIIGVKKRYGSHADLQGSRLPFGKTFLRGISTLLIGFCFLVLFWAQMLSALSVVLAVGGLLVIQEYLLHAIYGVSEKRR